MAERWAHEKGDISWKWVVGTAIALTATAVVIHLALAGVLWGFTRVGGTVGQAPSNPAPPAHLHARAEADRLELAGRSRLAPGGPAHPGIEAAMSRLVETGWPPQKAPAEGATR